MALGEPVNGGLELSRPRMDRSTLVWLVVGTVLGCALLIVVARRSDWAQLRTGVRRADRGWTSAALVSVLLTTAGKVARWRYLYPRERRPGYLVSARSLAIGQLANALLPARLGDLARAYLVGRETQVGADTALGTVAAEKAFDVVFLFVTGGIAAALVPLPRWLDWTLLLLTGGGLLSVLLALVWSEERLLARAEGRGRRWAGPAGRWVAQTLRRVMLGLHVFRSPRLATIAVGWSALIWAAAAGTNYLLFLAYGLPLRGGAALLLLAILHAGIAPPSSPGKLGVFHAITVWTLSTMGVDLDVSLAYGVVLHLLVYGPQVVLGVVGLASLGWTRGAGA